MVMKTVKNRVEVLRSKKMKKGVYPYDRYLFDSYKFDLENGITCDAELLDGTPEGEALLKEGIAVRTNGKFPYYVNIEATKRRTIGGGKLSPRKRLLSLVK